MEIESEISSFFLQSLRREVDRDADVFALGLVDSLFAMQLVVFVESAFGIVVEHTDLDIDNFRSISALGAFVNHKLSIETKEPKAAC